MISLHSRDIQQGDPLILQALKSHVRMDVPELDPQHVKIQPDESHR